MNTFARTLVTFSRRRPLSVLAVTTIIIVLACLGIARELTFNTDTRALFDRDLSFRVAEREFETQFPNDYDLTIAVIDGPSARETQAAASRLTTALEMHSDIFESVRNPAGGEFFDQNGLLYLSVEELDSLAADLAAAQPLLGAIATDRNARGMFRLFDLVYTAAAHGEDGVSAFSNTADQAADVIDKSLAGADAQMNWHDLFAALAPDQPSRALVVTKPILDIAALQQGEVAARTIRTAAQDLGLTPEAGYRVRLTGQIPLNDDEFVTVAEGTGLAGLIALALVTLLLFMALGSGRVVGVSAVTLVVGLIITMGWATLSVGELNLISVAFAIMFVGLGVDFSIQFCTRYRAELFTESQTPEGQGRALDATGALMARPLSLAAAATAIGFFSFLPTEYRGVSQLGVIAGGGMLIALALNFTALPALLSLVRPKGETEHIGYTWAAPFNRALIDRRTVVLSLALMCALGAASALPRLAFDFDPLKLKDPKSESMATALDLMSDPLINPNTLNVLVEDENDVGPLAERLAALSEVSHTITVFDLVPAHQDEKLTILDDLYLILGPTLEPGASVAPTPDDLRTAAAGAESAIQTYLSSEYAAGDLQQTAERLAPLLTRVATDADDATLEVLSNAFLNGFDAALSPLQTALNAERVTLSGLPEELRSSFIARDGRYRIQIAPADLSPDIETLARFVHAVRTIAPSAIGDPVVIYETGALVTRAFASAAIFAVIAITILLALVMRRILDVIRVLTPMILAALLTLGTCAAIGLPLNFANVIALPLLLGVGVAYPIYFVTAWRAGEETLLAAPAGRAMVFSALTTTAAFGSLALSTHIGTASMGILLTIAMAYTLIATLVVLTAMLGRPPKPSVKQGQ